jgi:hypothetical protein
VTVKVQSNAKTAAKLSSGKIEKLEADCYAEKT